jgi:hypothetical protein
MKVWLHVLCAALLLAGVGLSQRASAVGCLSGGAVGAAAGHMAHHGVLGAVGGCVAGHEMHNAQKGRAAQARQQNAAGGAPQGPGQGAGGSSPGER